MLVQRAETNLQPSFLENVGEPAFRKTAVQRHLTAFESDLARITGTRLLSLLTAPSGLPQTRAWSTSNAFLLVGRTLCRFKTIKTDSHHLLPTIRENL